MRFRVLIESGDDEHAFGVVVPDVPGCFSAGDTLEEALANAREAIAAHLQALSEDGQPVPVPSPTAQDARAEPGFFWASVEV